MSVAPSIHSLKRLALEERLRSGAQLHVAWCSLATSPGGYFAASIVPHPDSDMIGIGDSVEQAVGDLEALLLHADRPELFE